jgi:hypothetical protein
MDKHFGNEAVRILTGKTIAKVEPCTVAECDGYNTLTLTFSDETQATIYLKDVYGPGDGWESLAIIEGDYDTAQNDCIKTAKLNSDGAGLDTDPSQRS